MKRVNLRKQNQPPTDGDKKTTLEREERIRSVLEKRQPTLRVVLENIHDPHNLNAILRSCDATGVLNVDLLYTYEDFPDLIKHGKQSSSGARKWIRRAEYSSEKECLSSLKKKGFKVYASALNEKAIPLHDINLTEKVALVFSNEHKGASEELLELADAPFYIPMVGMTQSLNVSVAAAVSLYEAFRQRKEAGFYENTQLSEDEFESIVHEWSVMKKRVRPVKDP